MAKLKCIDDLVTEFRKKTPVRAGSLIISIFGDSIYQHGNSVWLGSLIKILEPFGLNQRQIRTAVFRLVQEQWLFAKQVGRRSYYSFTDSGIRHYEKAARRIYSSKRPVWDGKWVMVIPAFVDNEERDLLRKELLWLGFGAIAPGILAHPAADRQSLDETLQELDVTDKVVVMEANTKDLVSKETLKNLAHNSWNLAEVTVRYERFLDIFRPILQAVKKSRNIDPEQCFQARTLLIHEYRRILLNDTDLPDALLPANWPGKTAINLTANLYRAIHRQAMSFLVEYMDTAEGNLPAADAGYFARFGGIE